MYYMVGCLYADFGIGNITGTRYFLGDISKEGKDALISINKARKQWEIKNAKAQKAYSYLNTTPDNFIGSTSKYPPENRFSGKDITPRERYLNREFLSHDNIHALPMVLNRTGMGISPTPLGERLVASLERRLKQTPDHHAVRGKDKMDVFKYTVKEPKYSYISGRVTPNTSKAQDNYLSDIVEQVQNTPGMPEALEASNYIGARSAYLRRKDPKTPHAF